MKYLPLSPKDKAEMLAFLGVEQIDDLFASIPKPLRFSRDLNIPKAKSELELQSYFQDLARANTEFRSSFLGAGTYRHFCPVVVDHLSGRQEFFTSYTPYQPEISQGNLQALFEFQTMMTTLTGLDVSNASMYDGATAAAEAALMALRLQRKRRRLVISEGLHPYYRQVIQTYLSNLDVEITWLGLENDRTEPHLLDEVLDKDVAAVLVGYPNFFGQVEPLSDIVAKASAQKVMTVSVTMEALGLALLKTPGAHGVDIAVGEAQSFGVPSSFGGPHLGFFTCKDEHKRQMPGRICGMTLDRNGKRGFVLTLNAREQHIRRAKATSNICSNQGLCALRATIYLGAFGKHGLRELAGQNLAKTEYLKSCLGRIAGVTIRQGVNFNEFVVKLPIPAEKVVPALTAQGIHPGFDLGRTHQDRGHELLVAVTETNTRNHMDGFAKALEAQL